MPANIPGRPMYTPSQLMKLGLFTAGGMFMKMLINAGKKASQKNQTSGNNRVATDETVTRYVDQPVDGPGNSMSRPGISPTRGTSNIRRPVPVKIRVNQVATDVNEIISNPQMNKSIEFKDYIGPYHVYPNGAVYSGGNYSDESVQLIPYASMIEPAERKDELVGGGPKVSTDEEKVLSSNNTIYFKLTGKRFHKHVAPNYYYPIPTDNDYENANFTRYFVQRINDQDEIIEIHMQDYTEINRDNTVGIDGGIWRYTELQWTIDGPIKDVRKRNLQILLEANGRMPGIVNYLTDLDEFHKAAHGKNRTMIDLDTRVYDDNEPVPRNLPVSYATTPDNHIGQKCANCRFRRENVCRRWNATIRGNYWCETWQGAVQSRNLPLLTR